MRTPGRVSTLSVLDVRYALTQFDEGGCEMNLVAVGRQSRGESNTITRDRQVSSKTYGRRRASRELESKAVDVLPPLLPSQSMSLSAAHTGPKIQDTYR